MANQQGQESSGGSSARGGGAGNGGGTNVRGTSTPLLGRTWTILFAVIIMAAFGFILVYATSKVPSFNETHWSRLIFIYGGIEAIAFGVVGAIFGTTIQRQATDQANVRANESAEQANAERERADQNQQAAANGQALARVIKGEAKNSPVVNQLAAMRADTAVAPTTPAEAIAAQLQRLSSVAEELFPQA